MAMVAEKLYPPVIASSIPAFYKEANGTATIAVPFSMNKAVSRDQVDGFKLKIKTAQSNKLLAVLSVNNPAIAKGYVDEKTVKFNWENMTLNPGTYLKVQLAYVHREGTGTNEKEIVGYFSTVAVIKYTTKPLISIMGLDINDSGGIPLFHSTCTGVYEVTEDKNERPYSYCFYLYDNASNLVETSGWKLHNSSVNNNLSESLQLEETHDVYTFKTSLIENQEYYVQYGVRTINNLETFSQRYVCIELGEHVDDLKAQLVAENNFEEGYVLLTLQPKDTFTTLATPVSIEISRADVGYSLSQELIEDANFDIMNYQFNWQPLSTIYFPATTTADEVSAKKFRDFTIEQGVQYLYCYKQYDENGYFTTRMVSNIVQADFEDMFLFDGKKQLKIRFNPKVSSFKTTIQEQKIDTIGSKYPFFFRNGIVSYKEFPISGLISYQTDRNEEWFYDFQKDLDILNEDDTRREGTPTGLQTYENTVTLDSIAYNMRAERRFKLAVMEWLSNGEIKMFKSPAEGNYLVRLMNISLTPEDKLGRMIHSFTANAYEVEEYSYDNLIKLNMITLNKEEENSIQHRSVLLQDIIQDYYDNLDNAATNFTNATIIPLNTATIYDLMQIELAPSVANNDVCYYIRIGEDRYDTGNKVLITPNRFQIDAKGQLPDLWYCVGDNVSYYDTETNNNLLDQVLGLVSDNVLTYKYKETTENVGQIGNILEIYIKNKIGTLIGPGTLNYQSTNNNTSSEILQYYVLNFEKKEIITIYSNNSTYYQTYENGTYSNPITEFDENALYQIDTTIYKPNGDSLASLGSNPERIVITLQDGQQLEYTDKPIIQNIYKSDFITNITIGDNYYLEYAYQEKTVSRRQGE